MSHILLLDQGNTRVKWALVSSATAKFEYQNSLSETTFAATDFIDQLNTLPKFSQAYLASVGNPQLKSELCNIMEAEFCIPCVELETQAQSYQLTNSYSVPQQLGIDRWLNMLAAFKQYQTAVMVVSLGTATTIDIVSADGKHQGGFILPGISMMNASLKNETANKNIAVQLAGISDLGLANNTQLATAKGVLLSQVASIEKIYQNNQAQSLQLILTGGHAQLLEPLISIPYQLEYDLIFKGMLLQIQQLNA